MADITITVDEIKLSIALKLIESLDRDTPDWHPIKAHNADIVNHIRKAIANAQPTDYDTVVGTVNGLPAQNREKK